MKSGCLYLLAFFAFTSSASEQTIELSHAELRRALQEHVSQPRFESALWGVKVVSLASGQVLYETNSSKLLKPASNAKLYTGALALDRFGPEHRIRTSLYSGKRVGEDGTLPGDLIIYGRGDFSKAARFNGGSYSNLLGDVVEAVKAAGIKRIEGNLVGEETYFRGPRMGSSWSWDDLNYYYGAEASALTIQDNVIDLYLKPADLIGEPCSLMLKPQTEFVQFINRTSTGQTNSRARINVYRPLGENSVYLTGQLPLGGGTVEEAATVSDPALWYVTLLKDALQKAGVQVAGRLETRSWPEDQPAEIGKLTEIASVESRPFREMVEKMMKPSQNLYAQLLLLQVGAHSDVGMLAEDAGIRAMRAFLSRAGVAPGEALLDEGSGLSRSCLVTPRATVQLLQFMHGHPHAAVYKASLPEAGVDGTLRSRLKELRGNLRAKTGTLRYVNSLSGYMTSAAGEPLAFCIMLNAYQNTGSVSSRAEIDIIPRLLARLGEKVPVPSEAVE